MIRGGCNRSSCRSDMKIPSGHQALGVLFLYGYRQPNIIYTLEHTLGVWGRGPMKMRKIGDFFGYMNYFRNFAAEKEK